ncbi:Arc family DNA-binding protein [Sulfitobacter sp. 1A13730]|uniref:Arc family DNA-binding protein n=1 Tax=Sulfitobacter sp. 1A13730 TaxID=3368569 RepID=UPI003745FBDE
MARETNAQFKLNLPRQLKAQLERAASDNLRSLNGEITYRLLKSFEPPYGEIDDRVKKIVETALTQIRGALDENDQHSGKSSIGQ